MKNINWKWLLFSFKGRINRKKYWGFIAIFLILVLIIGGILVSQSMIETARMQQFCRENSQAGYVTSCKELALLNKKYEQAHEIYHDTKPRDFCYAQKSSVNFNDNCDVFVQFRSDYQNKYGPGKAGGAIILSVGCLILGAVLIWMSLTVAAKRLHDRNLSGWWQALPLGIVFIGGFLKAYSGQELVALPYILFLGNIVSLIIFIICGFLKGTAGNNKYGADPLSIEQPK